MSEISFDLVICTYNNSALLDRTLKALAWQKTPPHVKWSVLVVDNNCTDGTANVVERYIESGQIPNIRCIVEKRQGLTYARLCGVYNTTAEWIAFIDDDCLLENDWLTKAAEFAPIHLRCGAFGGKIVLHWEAPPPSYALKHAGIFAAQDWGSNEQRMPLDGWITLRGAGLVLRRQSIEASGWLERQFLSDRQGQNLASGGDLEIQKRICDAGYELWYVPTCKIEHIIPAKRMSLLYMYRLFHGFGYTVPFVLLLFCKGSRFRWSVLELLWGGIYLLNILVKRKDKLNRYTSINDLVFCWKYLCGQFHAVLEIARMTRTELQNWSNLGNKSL